MSRTVNAKTTGARGFGRYLVICGGLGRLFSNMEGENPMGEPTEAEASESEVPRLLTLLALLALLTLLTLLKVSSWLRTRETL